MLLPAFTRATGIRVRAVAKGTGAALRDGMDGNVDVVLVHARSREEEFVRQGYGTRRYAVMHNDFIIAGPGADPAGIRGMRAAPAALARIAAAHAPFVSRGDDSGTHIRERDLWRRSGVAVTADGTPRPGPDRAWYLAVGQGMGKTLRFADEKQAYVLVDRGTYVKYTLGSDTPIDLQILCQGDPALANPYGVIPVNPKRFPHVHYPQALAFVRWLVSPAGQGVIAAYRLHGQQLFFPDTAADGQ